MLPAFERIRKSLEFLELLQASSTIPPTSSAAQTLIRIHHCAVRNVIIRRSGEAMCRSGIQRRGGYGFSVSSCRRDVGDSALTRAGCQHETTPVLGPRVQPLASENDTSVASGLSMLD